MRSSLLLAACGLLLAACDTQSLEADLTSDAVAAAASASGPSASGHANLTVGGGLQTFSFNAREDRNGVVSGTFQLKSRGQHVKVHGTIECLSVVGNTAYLNGTVTRLDDQNPIPFDYAVGDHVYFAVVDNGEGRGAVDEWTDLYPAFDYPFCIDEGLPMEPNEGGNIQVRP